VLRERPVEDPTAIAAELAHVEASIAALGEATVNGARTGSNACAIQFAASTRSFGLFQAD
jgi:hypothetical protein